jgi:hypothetical protein
MSYTKDRSVYFPRFSSVGYSDYYPPGANKTSCISQKLLRTRTGDRLPNFQSLIAEGKNATTNLTGKWESLESTNVDAFVDWSTGGVRYLLSFTEDATWNVYYPGPHTTPQSVYDAAKARASARAFEAIRKAQVAVSGPTFLGELRETLQMLTRPVAGLQDMIKRYLNNVRLRKAGGRRNQGLPNNWAKDLSNMWLEQAFGWTPLIHDIQDAMKAYHSLFDKDRVVKFSVGSRAFKDDGFWTAINSSVAGHPFYFQRRSRMNATHEVVCRYRGAVHARAATTAQDKAARFGFTPSEFVPTAWELLPWSFLVDYFTNIGDILEASVTDTSNLAWLSRAQVGVVEITYVSELGFYSGFPYTLNSFRCSPGKARYRQRSVTRDKAPDLSVPDLKFRLPTSPFQLLNMVALLGQTNKAVHPQNPRPWP